MGGREEDWWETDRWHRPWQLVVQEGEDCGLPFGEEGAEVPQAERRGLDQQGLPRERPPSEGYCQSRFGAPRVHRPLSRGIMLMGSNSHFISRAEFH